MFTGTSSTCQLIRAPLATLQLIRCICVSQLWFYCCLVGSVEKPIKLLYENAHLSPYPIPCSVRVWVSDLRTLSAFTCILNACSIGVNNWSNQIFCPQSSYFIFIWVETSCHLRPDGDLQCFTLLFVAHTGRTFTSAPAIGSNGWVYAPCVESAFWHLLGSYLVATTASRLLVSKSLGHLCIHMYTFYVAGRRNFVLLHACKCT